MAAVAASMGVKGSGSLGRATHQVHEKRLCLLDLPVNKAVGTAAGRQRGRQPSQRLRHRRKCGRLGDQSQHGVNEGEPLQPWTAVPASLPVEEDHAREGEPVRTGLQPELVGASLDLGAVLDECQRFGVRADPAQVVDHHRLVGDVTEVPTCQSSRRGRLASPRAGHKSDHPSIVVAQTTSVEHQPNPGEPVDHPEGQSGRRLVPAPCANPIPERVYSERVVAVLVLGEATGPVPTRQRLGRSRVHLQADGLAHKGEPEGDSNLGPQRIGH